MNLEQKSWQWVMLIFLAFLWGSSFIMMKRGLDSFSHEQVAGYRIFIAFFVLIPYVFKHLSLLKSKYFFPLLFTGLFGNCLPAFFFTKAQTMLPSGFTGMLNSLVPLFTLLLGLLVFGLKTRWINILGVIVGFSGAVGLLLSNGMDGWSGNFGYAFYVIAATICYAISVNVIKKYLHDINPVVITSLSFLFVGPVVGIYLFSTDFTSRVLTEGQGWVNLGYLTILGVLGTAFAVVLFNMLIKKTTALFASSVTYLIPVVAIFWGFMDGEIISGFQLLSIGVILVGVYLVNKPGM